MKYKKITSAAVPQSDCNFFIMCGTALRTFQVLLQFLFSSVVYGFHTFFHFVANTVWCSFYAVYQYGLFRVGYEEVMF